MSKKNVLFVCEMNTCRSQIAEGWTRHLHSDQINAFSAGISTGPLDPFAINVMEEVGIDISGQETHLVSEFLQEDLDLVVTVCSSAAEKCPTFPPEVNVVCKAFDDPPVLIHGIEDEGEKLDIYRRVRDEIKQLVEGLPGQLN